VDNGCSRGDSLVPPYIGGSGPNRLRGRGACTVANDEQKNEYLREHLPYEMKMLRYTSKQMLERQHYLSWNAHYEAFAVHARNLANFLSNDDKGNFKAREFVSTFSAKKGELGTAMQTLTNQVFHLAKSRPSTPIGKFNTEHATPVCEWIENNFADFLNKLSLLSPAQRQMYDDKKADPSADEGKSQMTGPTAAGAPPSVSSLTGVVTLTTSESKRA
jgi:hypothetical protein